MHMRKQDIYTYKERERQRHRWWTNHLAPALEDVEDVGPHLLHSLCCCIRTFTVMVYQDC